MKKLKPDFTRYMKLGDDKNNRKVVENGEGEIIYAKRSNNNTFEVSLYGPCINCHEWMLLKGLKETLFKMVCICRWYMEEGFGSEVKNFSKTYKSEPSKMMSTEVFSIMRSDQISKRAQKDPLII